MDIKVRDSNGAQLAEGDSVTLIKDLKLKGSSTVLKRGTVIKNIHLTDDPDEIEGRTDKVKGLVLRTEFLREGVRVDRLTRPSFANPSSNRCYKSGMEQLAIKLLGFAAATCTTLAYAPQFVKVWRTRSTEDISLGMFLVMVLGILLWLLYGLLSGDAPLIVANAITIVLAGGILVDEAEVRLSARVPQINPSWVTGRSRSPRMQSS